MKTLKLASILSCALIALTLSACGSHNSNSSAPGAVGITGLDNAGCPGDLAPICAHGVIQCADSPFRADIAKWRPNLNEYASHFETCQATSNEMCRLGTNDCGPYHGCGYTLDGTVACLPRTDIDPDQFSSADREREQNYIPPRIRDRREERREDGRGSGRRR